MSMELVSSGLRKPMAGVERKGERELRSWRDGEGAFYKVRVSGTASAYLWACTGYILYYRARTYNNTDMGPEYVRTARVYGEVPLRCSVRHGAYIYELCKRTT